jgi:RNA polymerase sigma factor (sigma-70 family)
MRLLREFEPKHAESFYGYLKTIAASVTYDHCRAALSKKRSSPAAVEVPADSDSARLPETTAGSAESIQRAILLQEIDEVLRLLVGNEANRDRRIFWLYYRHGLTAQAIADLPTIDLSVKGVEGVLHRLNAFVRQHLVEDELDAAG